MYKKLRNFGTVPPGVTNLVSKCVGNLKENCHKVDIVARALRVAELSREMSRGGGGHHSLIRVKVKDSKVTELRLKITFYSHNFG